VRVRAPRPLAINWLHAIARPIVAASARGDAR
jgi:hypothetical protein